MKRNYSGCAICDSTWGNVWAEIEGERLFFCCELCVVQYRGLIERIHQETGWSTIDSIDLAGDRRGRNCQVRAGNREAAFLFAFNSEGRILRFERGEPSAA
ncbi:MAG: TA0938 family protein [Thermoplasmata archaeon]